jgi:hypothetical protein
MSPEAGNYWADSAVWLLHKKLDRIIDRQTEVDRVHFRRRPSRRWLLRRAFAAEVKENTLVGRLGALPPGEAWFNAVRRIGPAGLVRNVFAAPRQLATDISDHEIEALLPPAIVADLEQLDAQFPVVRR